MSEIRIDQIRLDGWDEIGLDLRSYAEHGRVQVVRLDQISLD